MSPMAPPSPLLAGGGAWRCKIAMPHPAETAAGIYVHLPFCRRKCPYCDFYSTVGDAAHRRRFVKALHREMALRAAPDLAADSLYLGGGTPSLFTPAQISGIIGRARSDFGLTADAEITLEANPGTLSPDRLSAYCQAGVNRINIGGQSFDDRHLAFLGRIHNAAQIHRALDDARTAGFENIGIDLIYGLPDQSPAAWRADLAAALAAVPMHLSCYMLTYAAGTPLAARRDRGALRPLDDTAVAALFETTAEVLTAGGFVHYEIANFARGTDPPRWSRHNRKYWHRAPYLGFGPAAHSFDGTRRTWTAPSLDAYLQALSGGRLPSGGAERLTRDQHMIETIFLGLRQAAGIDIPAFETRFDLEFMSLFGREAAAMVETGLAMIDPDRLRLTRNGWLVADAAAARLAACF